MIANLRSASMSLKLLIVDDIKSMRDEFSHVCREFIPDARIEEAQDVMQAMEMISRPGNSYDVVFTDINMPAISGLKLISNLREIQAYRNTPLIVISTMAGRQDIERALLLGANGYLLRPLQKEDFEIVHLAYLKPIQDKRKDGSVQDAEALVQSLRKPSKPEN